MKVFVSGHRGLVGSEIMAETGSLGHEIISATRDQLDLRNRKAVFDFVLSQEPDCVIIAAAVVGGIKANMERPVDFLSENLQIQTNLLDACHAAKVPKVVFLGSSCIYPKFAEQPISEKSLLTGPLEPTNEAYALAKIAGVSLVRSYNKQFGYGWVSLMPTNVYGLGDNFTNEDSHVMPALIRKISTAKRLDYAEVEIWGTGKPLREFIHAKDLARAVSFVISQPEIPHDLLNVGTGEEISISELATLVADLVGYTGKLTYDSSMPDGTPRKVVDSSLIRGMGWRPSIRLREGLSGLLRSI